MSENCLAVVEINQDQCSRCYVYQSVCPYEAIKRDSDGKVEVKSENCQACGICYSASPVATIKMQYYTYESPRNAGEFNQKLEAFYEKISSLPQSLVLVEAKVKRTK